MRFVLTSILMLWAAVTWAQAFIPFWPDIPLPDGAQSEPILDFDTADTHLTQVAIYSSLSAVDFRQFYADTLPQLGWQADGTNRFVKDEDTLALEEIESTKGTSIFRLELKTHNKNP